MEFATQGARCCGLAALARTTNALIKHFLSLANLDSRDRIYR
jgi:hypothetical protein